MSFKKVIAKAKERYEDVKRYMEEREVNREEKEIAKLEAQAGYAQRKADAQAKINRYEKLKAQHSRMKGQETKQGSRIKKNLEGFKDRGAGFRW